MKPETFAGDKPQSGYEWLDATMNACAHVQAQMLFAVFSIGQAGALFRTKPEQAEMFLERIEIDVADFEQAAKLYAETIRSVIANGRENLAGQ